MAQGLNISRRFGGGVDSQNATQERLDNLRGGVAPTLQRAVVVDVIYDPTALSDNEITELENKVQNPELVEGMPYNSIIGRILTNSQDLTQSSLHVFYPLYPIHFQMPIKPGEQVLIVYEDYSRKGNTFGYWMTRPPAARQVEDTNYTHADRVFDPYNHPRNIKPNILANLTASAPTFPNGAGTPESYSIAPSGSRNPYDDILRDSLASSLVVFEPVPRLKKRPGDFLIQGSNNAAILLGTDRTGPVVPLTGSNGKDIREKAGVIDIVVGLGSVRKMPTNHNSDPGASTYNPTAPRVIENVRGKQEVYKTPYKSQKRDNPKEGDPDFLRDLSRLYMAMKTKGDVNFGINFGGENGIFPSSQDKFGTAIADLPSDNQNGQPFIVLKSEQLRFVAKGKDQNNGPSEHGEIRFIKEGKVSDKDLSLFVMDKTGRILMIGKDIQFQTHEGGKVLLKCKTADPSDADPMVLFSKFKELISEIHTKMETMKTTIAEQIGSLGSRGLVVPNAAGPFSPIPGLLTLKAFTAIAQANIQRVDVDFTRKIDPCKSKWVFINKENG